VWYEVDHPDTSAALTESEKEEAESKEMDSWDREEGTDSFPTAEDIYA